LTADEFEIMKTHAQIGSNVLSGSNYPYIQMAASIAQTTMKLGRYGLSQEAEGRGDSDRRQNRHAL
jgi:hypothetical protein